MCVLAKARDEGIWELDAWLGGYLKGVDEREVRMEGCGGEGRRDWEVEGEVRVGKFLG